MRDRDPKNLTDLYKLRVLFLPSQNLWLSGSASPFFHTPRRLFHRDAWFSTGFPQANSEIVVFWVNWGKFDFHRGNRLKKSASSHE
jgi:hypothetical protein